MVLSPPAEIARELGLSPHQVEKTANFLSDGATVPFLARYRKEATGALDEVQITQIRDRLEQRAELDKRRQSILGSLKERGLADPELLAKLERASTKAELEDVYLPYRPKRRTRAQIARERGLEPLAMLLLEQRSEVRPDEVAQKFVDPDRDLPDSATALQGARDIVAELASENASCRAKLRELLGREGELVAKVARGKRDEASKYRDYFDWREPVARAAGHRVLALFRGEREGLLSVSIPLDEARALKVLTQTFVKNRSASAEEIRSAVQDSYKRLIAPSIENDLRAELKERADTEAIRVFSDNLRELLLAPPLGQRSVLALDPGFRTGSKLVCLDRQGALLEHSVIYPHSGAARREQAGQILKKLLDRYAIEAIAIGNGTASRETETFVRSVTAGSPVPIVLVNESGASIYSASEIARREFPDHDVTVRGAVSIGRRLMDPLAELVKLDPKSIGVGQYQHDVDQKALKRGLDDVVSSCVNAVGVDLNTASEELLTYVSGLGPQLARNIVNHRTQQGAFKSRAELLKVPRLGAKAFEQAAGFLRVRDSRNPLDASAVHPESYPVVESIARRLRTDVSDLLGDSELRNKLNLEEFVDDRVGLPTLEDILSELAKPGRDPRREFEVFSFAEGIETLEDLKPGMTIPGVVTNVTNFGAFVDVGVHQDGLVHVSQLADRFVKDPADVVKVGDTVKPRVLEVDLERRRISLSLKRDPSASGASRN